MDERPDPAETPGVPESKPAGASGRPTRGGRRQRGSDEPPLRAWVSSDRPGEPAAEPTPVDLDTSFGGIVGHLQAVAEPVPSPIEPFVQHVVTPVAGAIGSAIGAASQAWSDRLASMGGRVRRMAREPLANLYEVYPEARLASPRELGLRFVPVEEVRGTAVAGIAQRGGDFLPLKPFRGENWEARWGRIRQANERLQPLPPVDLIKYDGEYWVVDGHNRVAATLYSNGVGLDAMVTELIPLDGQTSERPTQLLSMIGEASQVRAAARGRRPAVEFRPSEILRPDAPGLSAPEAHDETGERRSPTEPAGPEVPEER